MTHSAYFFSTLLASLLSPLGLYLEAMLLTMVAPLGWIRKNRRRLAVTFTLLFAFACTDFCGKTMLSALEHLAVVSQPPASRDAVFIVLGGGAVAEGDIYQPSIASQIPLVQGRPVSIVSSYRTRHPSPFRTESAVSPSSRSKGAKLR